MPDRVSVNPYTLTFGIKPKEYIERLSDTQEVLGNFLSEEPSQQIYMITGVRGSGKTVFLTTITNRLRTYKDWVIVDMNPNNPDMIQFAAAALCSENEFANWFKSARLNFSLLGFGLEVQGAVPIADPQIALEKMLQQMTKHHKKILFVIDEAVPSHQIKAFAFAFQQFLRARYSVYLLMTGLYENISDLQNERSMTFLYRAPKIVLSPLNIGEMADNYFLTLGQSREEASDYARLTKGYSFAFQVLGYFGWETEGDYEKAIRLSRQYLEEQSYEKIWSELSRRDQELIKAIASIPDGSIQSIKAFMSIGQNELNPYRQRLIRKGIVISPSRGYLRFVLPFFEQYVLENYV